MKPIRTVDIRRVAQAIGAAFKPEKVYLFGSYAFGQPTPESDVDLLVLINTRLSNVEQAVRIRQQIPFHFATDLPVRTPAQIARRLQLGDVFLQDIVTNGVVLYENADA